jgi:Response regulator of the LytR/AlgR family
MKEYVRYSLKRVEEDLSDFTGFFRVHRSYVVNLNYVDSSFSKLNSMKLNFEKIPEQIPVGREYQKRVKQKLNQ